MIQIDFGLHSDAAIRLPAKWWVVPSKLSSKRHKLCIRVAKLKHAICEPILRRTSDPRNCPRYKLETISCYKLLSMLIEFTSHLGTMP
jgi:hypothetical protein